MAVRLQFEGVRCFSEPQEAVIRPITLLVGENSSGKTTFLALCQIAHAIAQRFGKDLPFNEPPFLLGAYDQIASYRGGRAGHTKSFSIKISTDEGVSPRSLHTEFVSRHGQPSLQVLRLTAGDLVFQVKSRGASGEHSSIVLAKPPRKTEIPHSSIDLRALTVLSRPTDWAALIDNEMLSAGGLSGEEVFTRPDFDSLENALDAIRKEFLRRPYAFAPIRTSPLRTYDPVSAEPKPEGSHVPMLLATLARSAAKGKWTALQAALKEFGSKSGLFGGVEIVNKGKKESDPFQVGIQSGGPVFNLIDVGYGVSQALPILVDTLQQSSPYESFLLQQPEVHLHPRAQAELGSFFAKQAGKRRRFVIETHSDYLVDRIRMEVRQNQLAPEDVSLLYFERQKHGAVIHSLELDSNGSITNPPPGFRQFFLNEERNLLGI
jgi:hypothetical protein